MKELMNKDFTFAGLVYNQESTIIEYLESIKYQILKFGKEYTINLLICDDHSSDNTVKYINKWIEINSAIFNEVILDVAKENRGIVQNNLYAIKQIKTNEFKILHGDDLYYKNSIFDIPKDANFIISPVIKFNNNGTIKKEWRDSYNCYLLKNENELIRKLRKQIKYTYPVETPGLFWKKELYDKKIDDNLLSYEIIEDVPLMNELFKKDNFKPIFYPKPLVLYRTLGISNTKNNSYRTKYDLERGKINNEIWGSIINKNKLIKNYRYIENKIYQIIYPNLSKVKFYYNNYLIEQSIAEEYYREIKENAIRFTEKYL